MLSLPLWLAPTLLKLVLDLGCFGSAFLGCVEENTVGVIEQPAFVTSGWVWGVIHT